jgi:metallo-beta-lactamase class B
MYVLALLPLLLAQPQPQPQPPSPALSQDPFPPHRIADDLYYVGSKGLASYLVTTKKGHILINPDFETTVPLLKSNVEKLGFKFTDVKILLNSHAHDDHVAGMALAKELSGADVYVMRGDDQVVATGGAGQYKYDGRWKPTSVKRVLEDGDKVTLGAATLVAHKTAGHTRGCTTWTMKVRDRGKALDAVIVCSPNVNPGYRLTNNQDYPEIAEDYRKSFQTWKALPCDIFLGAHANYYGMEEKYAKLAQDKKTNPFVDPAGYKAYIDERELNYRKTLIKQQVEKYSGNIP